MSILMPVILSGGTGTRLWPVSREGHPKPFMKLADGETLIEKTCRRAAKLPGVVQQDGKAALLTVTNRDYYFMSRDELHKAGATGSFLLEPCGRNTAPAIAMAAHCVQARFGPEALLLILSADHLIHDEVAFAEAVAQAAALAAQDYLVTFGIVPDGPATGFGYIKAGTAVDAAGAPDKAGYQVDAFVEKPDLVTARKYVASGGYYWNAGMFCCSAGQLLRELAAHAPDVAAGCDACWQAISSAAPGDNSLFEIPAALFQQVPDISIDYAVMERSRHVAVVPADIGWSDIGSWNAIRDLVEPDMQNNRAYGDAIFVNSKNTFVQAEDRLVAAVGLDNVMIVDTPDALLVASPEHAQDVKQVVSLLKKADHAAFKLHKTVLRPWGTYTVLEEGPGFKVKRVEVIPGGRLSLQMHQHRSEHWIVTEGKATVVNGSDQMIVERNQSTYIPAGHKHRLENSTQERLVIVEVQCGSYLGEDDIVRFEDNYGRT